MQRKQYTAYRRLRNFVCVPPVRQAKILAYAKVEPKGVDLVPGFMRDVTGLGHHGTGDLEVRARPGASGRPVSSGQRPGVAVVDAGRRCDWSQVWGVCVALRVPLVGGWVWAAVEQSILRGFPGG